MGAGNAGASLYSSSPNSNSGGGSKKQGVTSRVGLDGWSNRDIQISSNGRGRLQMFFMNQLGGVGAGHSMFGGRFGGSPGGIRHTNASSPVPVPPAPAGNILLARYAIGESDAFTVGWTPSSQVMRISSLMNLTNLDLLCIQVPYETILITFFLPIFGSPNVKTSLLAFGPGTPPPMDLNTIASYNAPVTPQASLTLGDGPFHVFVDKGVNHPEDQILLDTFNLYTSSDRIILRLNGPLLVPPPFRLSFPSDGEDISSSETSGSLLFVHNSVTNEAIYTYIVYVVLDASVHAYPEGSMPNEIIGTPCSIASVG